MSTHRRRVEAWSKTFHEDNLEINGSYNTIVGRNCIVHGGSNNVFGDDAVVHGSYNRVESNYCYVDGSSNKVYGENAECHGDYNNVFSSHCQVVGDSNKIKGTNVTCTGNWNNISGPGHDSVARGDNNKLDGDRCLAVGNWCTLRGADSRAEGNDCSLHGPNSHALGNRNSLSGQGSTAEGENNFVAGVDGVDALNVHSVASRARVAMLLEENQANFATYQASLQASMAESHASMAAAMAQISGLSAHAAAPVPTLSNGYGAFGLLGGGIAVKTPSTEDLRSDVKQDDGIGNDGGTCIICQDNKAICAALPCGHVSYCVQCSRDLCFGPGRGRGRNAKSIGQVKCANCRQNVHEMKRLFF